MANLPPTRHPELLDERDSTSFRALFGTLLSQSTVVDAAVLRIRLAAVDLSDHEFGKLKRMRVLVAEANAQTVEGEAYALVMDPLKRQNLARILGLLQNGVMEIRSAPLGGWSPDFTVFSGRQGPRHLLLGLHWFHNPFPYRGPAWAAHFGAKEAIRAKARFEELWEGAHDIGPAVQQMMERANVRGPWHAVDTRNGPG
jgi:hypothetical protein